MINIESTEFIMREIRTSKMNVVKELRNCMTLSLKEAKNVVDRLADGKDVEIEVEANFSVRIALRNFGFKVGESPLKDAIKQALNFAIEEEKYEFGRLLCEILKRF